MSTIISPHPFSRSQAPPHPTPQTCFQSNLPVLPSDPACPHPPLACHPQILSVRLPRLCPLFSPQGIIPWTSTPAGQPLLVHVACAPTTPDPACGLSLWIEHPKTCLQTQTWSQTQQPRPYRGTLHPDPAPSILPVDPDREPAPQTHHPDSACGFNTQTQHLRPYLQTQHSAPVCARSTRTQ